MGFCLVGRWVTGEGARGREGSPVWCYKGGEGNPL